uniref:Uncharacterized protein n=1 Tax=viral metagenome TaxID=1070528 RepID=A0A6C0KCY1_9ZZZZ
MADFDTNRLEKNGKEFTYMMTINGRDSSKVVKIEPPLKNVTSVEIVQARVPMSEYTIEYDRNILSILQNENTVEITLPSQNYSPKLMSKMVNLLGENLGLNITMQEIDNQGKFMILSTDSAFSITDGTTCHYPIGLPDGKTLESVYDANGGDGTPTWFIEFPNRYDLVVSDVILLSCEDLDTSITRGRNSDNFLKLAEFFLQSPGMTENYSNMPIPYRHFANPIASLEKMDLKFTRESEHGEVVDRLPYNFRGIKWYLKVAIKTKEYGSAPEFPEAPPPGLDPPAGEFISGSTGIRPKEGEIFIPTLGSGSYLPRNSDEYTFMPMASNSSDYS